MATKSIKEFKIKVNNVTVEWFVYKKEALTKAELLYRRGNKDVLLCNYKNEIIWRPSDIIEEDVH